MRECFMCELLGFAVSVSSVSPPDIVFIAANLCYMACPQNKQNLDDFKTWKLRKPGNFRSISYRLDYRG